MMALPSLWGVRRSSGQEQFANVHYRRAFLLLTGNSNLFWTRVKRVRSNTCIGSSMSIRTFLACLLMACAAPSAWAALEPKQVLVLVNKDTALSSQVGRMYQRLRAIQIGRASC